MTVTRQSIQTEQVSIVLLLLYSKKIIELQNVILVKECKFNLMILG